MKKQKENKEKTHSFGEYYDAQYERLREMLSNKDRKQHLEWAEELAARAKRKHNT